MFGFFKSLKERCEIVIALIGMFFLPFLNVAQTDLDMRRAEAARNLAKIKKKKQIVSEQELERALAEQGLRNVGEEKTLVQESLRSQTEKPQQQISSQFSPQQEARKRKTIITPEGKETTIGKPGISRERAQLSRIAGDPRQAEFVSRVGQTAQKVEVKRASSLSKRAIGREAETFERLGFTIGRFEPETSTVTVRGKGQIEKVRAGGIDLVGGVRSPAARAEATRAREQISLRKIGKPAAVKVSTIKTATTPFFATLSKKIIAPRVKSAAKGIDIFKQKLKFPLDLTKKILSPTAKKVSAKVELTKRGIISTARKAKQNLIYNLVPPKKKPTPLFDIQFRGGLDRYVQQENITFKSLYSKEGIKAGGIKTALVAGGLYKDNTIFVAPLTSGTVKYHELGHHIETTGGFGSGKQQFSIPRNITAPSKSKQFDAFLQLQSQYVRDRGINLTDVRTTKVGGNVTHITNRRFFNPEETKKLLKESPAGKKYIESISFKIGGYAKSQEFSESAAENVRAFYKSPSKYYKENPKIAEMILKATNITERPSDKVVVHKSRNIFAETKQRLDFPAKLSSKIIKSGAAGFVSEVKGAKAGAIIKARETKQRFKFPIDLTKKIIAPRVSNVVDTTKGIATNVGKRLEFPAQLASKIVKPRVESVIRGAKATKQGLEFPISLTTKIVAPRLKGVKDFSIRTAKSVGKVGGYVAKEFDIEVGTVTKRIIPPAKTTPTGFFGGLGREVGTTLRERPFSALAPSFILGGGIGFVSKAVGTAIKLPRVVSFGLGTAVTGTFVGAKVAQVIGEEDKSAKGRVVGKSILELGALGAGSVVGAKSFLKIEGRFRTRGRTEIPLADLASQKVISQGGLDIVPRRKQLKLFKKSGPGAFAQFGEKGPIVLTAVSGIKKEAALTGIAETGGIIKPGGEFLPGVFTAPSRNLATAFLGLDRGNFLKVFIPDLFGASGKPTIAAIRPLGIRVRKVVDVPGKKAASGQQLMRFTGKDRPGFAELPLQKLEPEAIISPGITRIVPVSQQTFTTVRGIRVPINLFQAAAVRGGTVTAPKPLTRTQRLRNLFRREPKRQQRLEDIVSDIDKATRTSLFTKSSLASSAARSRLFSSTKPSRVSSSTTSSRASSVLKSITSSSLTSSKSSSLRSSRTSSALKSSLRSSKTSSALSSILRSSLGSSATSSAASSILRSSPTSSAASSVVGSSRPFVPPPTIPQPRLRTQILIPKRKKSKKDRFKTQFRPSVAAIVLNIRAPQPKTLTGIGIRPIPV